MPGIQKFVFYSFSLHAVLVGSFLIRQFALQNAKEYYAVDFYGGGPAQDVGNGRDRSLQVKPGPDPVKENAVNPKEDLLIKSKKKDKKVKETISTIPIPKAPAAKSEAANASDAPSAVPDAVDGSGIGVGFGADGWKGGGSDGAGNFPFQWYVQMIKKKLDENWKVTGGFSRRIYTQVAFTITRNGSLADVEVEEKSGNDVFDYQAKRAVNASGPFPPLPRDFQEPALRVHVRFTVKR